NIQHYQDVRTVKKTCKCTLYVLFVFTVKKNINFKRSVYSLRNLKFIFKTMDRKHGRYQKLVAEFKRAHDQCDAEVAKIWSSLKKESNWDELTQLEINKWKLKSEEIHLKRNK
ncbi:hypothetical protein Bhyg_08789, partial [Pseudolycoriella hygida]